jgi:glycerol-3-phosphate acyltransferase PlsX
MEADTPRLALDAMGGDFAPEATVAGAVQARLEAGISAHLVGAQGAIQALLRAAGENPAEWSIEHAPDVIGMD